MRILRIAVLTLIIAWNIALTVAVYYHQLTDDAQLIAMQIQDARIAQMERIRVPRSVRQPVTTAELRGDKQ